MKPTRHRLPAHRKKGRRGFTAALVALIFFAAPAPGQTAEEVVLPRYEVLPWDEDWSVLRGVEDPGRFERIKFVPLGRSGNAWASFGLRWRLRPEIWSNFNFGLKPQTPNDRATDDSFLLSRVLFHGDFHLGDHFRVFLMGKSSLSTDRDLAGGITPAYRDTIDLQNGWVEARLPLRLDNVSVSLRAGREELLEGAQRLISPLDWSNVRRTFDGANLNVRSRRYRAKAFWSKPVRVREYDFNPSWGGNHSQFFGLYNTFHELPMVDGLDLYWLGLLRDDVTLNGSAGDENRQTIGARAWGDIGQTRLFYDSEFAWQFGDIGSADINAFMFSGYIGLPVEMFQRTVRAQVGFGYASGDDDPRDNSVETFNQLFPLAHKYLGRIDAIGRQNIIDTNLIASAETVLGVRALLELHYFWRASDDDALYSASGAVSRPGSAGNSLDVGGEIDLILSRGWGRHLRTDFGYSHFFAGNFIDQAATTPQFANADRDIDFVYFTFAWLI